MRIFERLRERRLRRAELDALEGLGASGYDALARDIGVSATLLPALILGGGKELPELMRSLELDAEGVAAKAPDLFRDMAVVCGQCSEASRCRRELAASTASSSFVEYCQ
jgi:hypothetical protein